MDRTTGVACLIAFAAACGAGSASAQSWPAKPIRLVLGYTVGGAAEGTARALQPRLEQLLGQPLVMEYKPGAGATIAVDYTAKSAPDGYTLHLVDSGPLTIVPNARNVGYDPIKSIAPIGLVCAGGTILVAHPSVPAANLEDLVRLARAKPGSLSYGTSGVGGAGHLAGELFKTVTRIDLVHVPYKGGGPAITELLGGQLPLLFSSMGTAVPYVKSGKIKALGVTSPDRSSALPEVPTIAEQGYPGFDATVWFALVGPPGLANDIISRVNQALRTTLDDPQVKDGIRKQGYEPSPTTPEGLLDRVRSDLAKWGKVVRDANIVME
jgi:tripartite-type tricarboxylate transporter receptor subunit TctC